MILVLLAALGVAWWLHKRGELLPELARWGGVAAAALIAARLMETGRVLPALLVAAAGYGWWQYRNRPGKSGDEAAAFALLGLAPGADAAAIQAAWRNRIAVAHPDAGGSDAAARAVTAARDLLLRRLEE